MTSRRIVLAGGCAAMLTGCQVYGETAAQEPPPAAPQPAAGGDSPLAELSDIPVGGGKIFADQKVVVTQPSAGEIRAFSAVCTHQGCLVTSVADGTIVCPCHGSAFRVSDGTVAAGPAKRELPPVRLAVSGDEIRLA